jgi:hypothetical protein
MELSDMPPEMFDMLFGSAKLVEPPQSWNWHALNSCAHLPVRVVSSRERTTQRSVTRYRRTQLRRAIAAAGDRVQAAPMSPAP